jgi:catechol 2,3-dioxygenase-like lactoylglutathione lyase family enzyme
MVKRIATLLFFSLLCVASLPAQSPALAGIAHVAFRVGDLQRTRDFYGSLGFEQAFEFADPGKPAVSYMKVNDRQFIELYEGADVAHPIGLMHVCYEAADIDAVWNEYVKRGLDPPASRKARAGNLLFLFHDPEGQVLEYTQYLPGSLHFEDRGKHLSEQRISREIMRVNVTVHDLAAERIFYTSKLGFQNSGTPGAVRLRVAANSREEVELETATPATKPHIVFAVDSLRLAAEKLLSRGLTVQKDLDSVSVSDPDGTVISFVAGAKESEGKP